MMRIVMIWSPSIPAVSLLQSAEMLVPALLYADKVTVLLPEPNFAGELEDLAELRKATGNSVELRGVDSQVVDAGTVESIFQQAATQADDSVAAFNILRFAYCCAVASTRDKYSEVSKRWPGIEDPGKFYGLVADSFEREGASLDLEDMREAGVFKRVTNKDRRKVRHFAALRPFLSESLQPNCYALVDDIRGAWRGMQLPPTLALSNGAQVRSASASLAVDSMRRLPSMSVKEWRSVGEARRTLHSPLVRFRAAMTELSRSSGSSPLDQDFDDFVESVWLEKIEPALQELEELVREARFRRLFFKDALRDLKTYAGPAFAFVASDFAHLSSVAQAAFSVATPAATLLGIQGEKRMALRRHDFFFLHAVQQMMGGSTA